MTFFTSVLNISVICLHHWKFSDQTSIWSSVKLIIYFYTCHMSFLRGYIRYAKKNSLTLKLCYNHMHFLLKHHSTTFLSFFHHPLTYINPTILIDAILKVSTLQLLVIFGSCVVYSHHTTQQSHHHHYNH